MHGTTESRACRCHPDNAAGFARCGVDMANLNHKHFRGGFWAVGVANALPLKPGEPGSEDGYLAGAALEVWKRVDMPTAREAAITDVSARVAAGELTCFADWPKLIVHPPTKGEYRYGEELEGLLAEGERPWLEPQDAEHVARDERILKNLTCDLESLPTDSLVAVEEARRYATQLQGLNGFGHRCMLMACPASSRPLTSGSEVLSPAGSL